MRANQEPTGKNVWHIAVLIFALLSGVMALWPAQSSAGGGAARPHGCPVSGGACDAGVYGAAYDGVTFTQWNKGSVVSRNFMGMRAGEGATYCADIKFGWPLGPSHEGLGDTYATNSGTMGGWRLYLNTSRCVQWVNIDQGGASSAIESCPAAEAMGVLDGGGNYHTLCVRKNPANAVELLVDALVYADGGTSLTYNCGMFFGFGAIFQGGPYGLFNGEAKRLLYVDSTLTDAQITEWVGGGSPSKYLDGGMQFFESFDRGFAYQPAWPLYPSTTNAFHFARVSP